MVTNSNWIVVFFKKEIKFVKTCLLEAGIDLLVLLISPLFTSSQQLILLLSPDQANPDLVQRGHRASHGEKKLELAKLALRIVEVLATPA
jgi:hypothetical protein